MSKKTFDISIIITCHAEGILLHKTLLSTYRSMEALPSAVSIEIIVHADNPTAATQDYLSRINTHFSGIKVITNSFGDPGKSRNHCIDVASGKYITFIDGDDLMSRNWLSGALETLESRPYGKFVAHSEMTVEFGGFNSIVQKYGTIDKETDSLLNVWSARWNAIIFAPSSLLRETRYPTNKPGYGYEDWLMSCEFIERDIQNILIPETVMFVRRKVQNSVWDTMKAASLVLPATQILSFEHIRTITPSADFLPPDTLVSESVQSKLKLKIKNKLLNTRLESVSRKVYGRIKSLKNTEKITPQSIPLWLLDEWKDIHSVERQVFPSDEIISNTKVYHTITELHYRLGGAYKKAVDLTRYNSYDYILLVPWLVSGGADSFAINYANAVERANPQKRVLVVTTMQHGSPSVWRDKLSETVDFIPLNDIFDEYKLEPEHQNRLLEQLIENSGASHLHVLNSILGYNFLERHATYLKGSHKKVIVTSFSQSTDESGRVFGFSHTHVPYVYDLADIITTDNTNVKDMWIDQYGFNENTILIHRPTIDTKRALGQIHGEKSSSTKVLWAARLAPEKIPTLALSVAQKLPHIQFDMYGTPDKDFDTSFLNSLPDNVSYKGAYNGFFSIPTGEYSAYLYTSLFDGLPNAMLEAGLAQLPIVASSVGGIPDFIQDSNGILINDINNPDTYANALGEILENAKLQERLSKSAYMNVLNNYSSESHQKSIEEMLKRVNY